MTVDFQKEAIQLRSELAMIRGMMHQMPSKLEPFPFTNLVQNGGFDAGLAGWTDSSAGAASASAVSGQLNLTGTASNRAELDQPFSTMSGRRYLLVATDVGGVPYQIPVGTSVGGNQLYADADGVGDTSTAFTAITNISHIRIRSRQVAETAIIDNVSLWEADPSDDAPWLRLNYGYSVKDCGGFVVRDGDILHPPEWEEINRCGQRFIKPLVAPGHDTDFLIFAGVAK